MPNKSKGRRQKKNFGSFGWCAPQRGLEGSLGRTTNFVQKTTSFRFCFHSIEKPSKRVKTQNICLICVFYLGVVKERLSSWFSVQTLNNFWGIIGKRFNFETDQLFCSIRSGDSKQWKISLTKSGSLSFDHNCLGEGGSSTLRCAPPKTTTFVFRRRSLVCLPNASEYFRLVSLFYFLFKNDQLLSFFDWHLLSLRLWLFYKFFLYSNARFNVHK